MHGIKWSRDRWRHVTQKGQSRDLLIFTCRCEYLENGLKLRLGTNCPLIGNGLWRIDWWRHRWLHVTFRVQGRDPNIFKARYFENGLRQRFSFNESPSPSPTLHKSCTKFTWRIYAHSECLLVRTVPTRVVTKVAGKMADWYMSYAHSICHTALHAMALCTATIGEIAYKLCTFLQTFNICVA